MNYCQIAAYSIYLNSCRVDYSSNLLEGIDRLLRGF